MSPLVLCVTANSARAVTFCEVSASSLTMTIGGPNSIAPTTALSLIQPLLWPRPSQFPSPSGEVRDLPCVAFPWYSSAGVGSGPGELIGVKVETLDTPPSWKMAVEPRHVQPRLFG